MYSMTVPTTCDVVTLYVADTPGPPEPWVFGGSPLLSSIWPYIPIPVLVGLLPGLTFRNTWDGKRRAGELRLMWPWWRRWF
jgi:hypothetical protein